MAEFVKIAKMAQRMCKESECVSCELNDCHGLCMLDNLHSNDPERIEQIIVKWACDHKRENAWYQHIEDGEWFGQWECGKCGQLTPCVYKYCPGCGQKMIGNADT